MLCAAGFTKRFPWVALRTLERFTPGEGWSVLEGADRWLPLYPRMHLVPDGRVMTCGSNPKRRVDELRIEPFEPPYLFADGRPVIDHAPDEVGYGAVDTVKTPDAPAVDEAALVRPSAMTHSVNTSQRYVGLPIESRTGDAITVRIPDNPHLLPPGYYMLFLVSDGVPSEAVFVRVPVRQ